ncbi:MAG: outer membrane lipoprotein carrier protein [Candidatus Pseudothioglobus sp.]|jgi:outer membrane lipoprotein carrier protein
MRRPNSPQRKWHLGLCCLLSAILRVTTILLVPTMSVEAAVNGTEAAVIDGEIDHTDALVQLLSSIQSVTANYAQITLDKDSRVVQQLDGNLSVNGPGRFRLESLAPSAQTLVSDGDSFWSYDSDLEQVIITPLQRDITQVPILLLGGDASAIAASYQVAYDQQAGRDLYRLTPLDTSSLFDSLTLAFVAGEPRAIILRDSLGQQTQIEMTRVVLNQPISEDTFIFTPPAGVDVIDDR